MNQEALTQQDPTQAWLERCAEAARARAEQRRQEALLAIRNQSPLAKPKKASAERRFQSVSRRRAT